MLSLKFSLASQVEFGTQVEQLSDAFRRSLILEGVSHEKANEMVVEKTVDLCRRNTNSDLIKSILESASFNSPKEVVAKLVTQIDKSRGEHQVLSFRSNRGRGRGNYRGRGYYGYKYNSQNNNNQYRQNEGGYNSQNSNDRGRGRGRGRGYYRGQNNRNIRVTSEQENSQVPQSNLGGNNI